MIGFSHVIKHLNFSFVRSVTMDKWKDTELEKMKVSNASFLNDSGYSNKQFMLKCIVSYKTRIKRFTVKRSKLNKTNRF